MKIHMVKSGDTMYTIAQKYSIELEQLIAFNPQISDPNTIDVGMKVKIPKSTLPEHAEIDYAHKHTVVQGDTLWKISKYWGLPLKALVDANPQLKNPSVLLTGETVYIPNTSPIHQAMTSNSANMAAPAQLNMANPMLPISENVQPKPNVQPPEQMPQAAPPMVEQQAMPPQMPVEEKHAMPQAPVLEEKHMMPQPPVLEEQHYKPMSPPLEAQQYMPKPPPMAKQQVMPPQMPFEEKHAMPQPSVLEAQYYKPMSPPLGAQQYMPKQEALPYAQPFMQPMTQPFSPIQQANIPEQKKESFNVYSDEHLFAQFNLPAVEAQGKPEHSYASQMPLWDYGQMPQLPPTQTYATELPTMPFAPSYGIPKPDCGCGCGGTKQNENLMYYSNPMEMPQPAYYPEAFPYYDDQQMQPYPQSLPYYSAEQTPPYPQSFPNEYPMSMQPPMQQSIPQPLQWEPNAAANLSYPPVGANYAYTMSYSFPATHPAAYMMPCYPMSTEMNYSPVMQLPYTTPYPYSNMPHQNIDAGWEDRENTEVPEAIQETVTKPEVKASRKSTTNRSARPSQDDRAVLHQFLQKRRTPEFVKETKSTQPWINY